MVNQRFNQIGEVPWLSESACWERLKHRPRVGGPLFVYSSMLGGWTDSSMGAFVNLDDHGFHRGDGVFEALRAVHRRPYLLREHSERMRRSAAALKIELPLDFESLDVILEAGLQKFSESEVLIRLFVTRGPGGFSTSPAECLGAQLFVALMPFRAPASEKYENGVRIGRSQISVKPGWLATAKTLNYLPNVMMKAESLARGLDFTIAFDENGVLTESSTENIIVLRKDGTLCFPPLARILSGCTMLRLFDLIEQQKLVATRREVPLSEADVREAQGLFMVGTTLDVLPVQSYEEVRFTLTNWGPRLRELIQADQAY